MEQSIPPLSLGALTVYPATYTACFDGRELPLSGTEIEILTFLLLNQERVASRGELAGILDRRESTVDILITRLRQKVGCNFIRNVRGRGWIIDPKRLELEI